VQSRDFDAATTALARPPGCSAFEISIDNTDLRD